MLRVKDTNGNEIDYLTGSAIQGETDLFEPETAMLVDNGTGISNLTVLDIVTKYTNRENGVAVITGLSQIAETNDLNVEDLDYLLNTDLIEEESDELPGYLFIGDELESGVDILAEAEGQQKNTFYESAIAGTDATNDFYEHAGIDWFELPSGRYVFDFSNR